MSASARRRSAVLVPDEMTWTMLGRDPAGMGLCPHIGAWTAGTPVVSATTLPAPLVEALADQLAPGQEMEVIDDLRLGGMAVLPALAEATREADDHHAGNGHQGGDEHGNHGHGDHKGHGHDHGDMMAIEGEPSRDGLVMEAIDVRVGPLVQLLPAGLVVHAQLDGDLVADCSIEQTLHAGESSRGDPLQISARRVADSAFADPWLAVAALELERALSHAAWLRSLCRLLGWSSAIGPAQSVIGVLTGLHPLDESRLDEARQTLHRALGPARDLCRALYASRRLRARLQGLAPIDIDEASAGRGGPVARACGLAADVRIDDERYSQLGFEPVVEQAGDALARTRVRLGEIAVSVRCAAAAVERVGQPGGVGDQPVEGPRGPLTTEAETVRIAEQAVVGLEWASALAAISSFDLSPWRAEA